MFDIFSERNHAIYRGMNVIACAYTQSKNYKNSEVISFTVESTDVFHPIRDER